MGDDGLPPERPLGPGEPRGLAGESARRGQSEYQGEDRDVR
jgi:hypothetical protein